MNAKLSQDLFPIHEIRNGSTYFAITLGARADGTIETSGQTIWIGFADKERRIEIRQLSEVRAEMMADYWVYFSQPFCVVNDDRSFARWFVTGGHAVVTKEMILKHVPLQLEPSACVREGFTGFSDIKKVPKSAFKKAPTPKLRMAILQRDQYRCIICGQRPADDVNIQLHVHHIRPFGNGGITTEKNLVTLCHTCHGGLKPHYEYSLFDLIEKETSNSDGQLKRRMLERYVQDIENYRKKVGALLGKYGKTEDEATDSL